ncbi:MAG: FAD-binding oxidoreductase [Spirochaetaceae bacterium]|nr:FAD-binding oxidoreductase [Spirochaetaceae bacterium]
MKKIETGKLAVIKNIANSLTYLKIKIEGNGENYAPGNFITILPPASSARFLRRPFSVAGISDGSIELIIKSIGPVTESLASLTQGTEIEIMGPLGNSYQIPENIKKLWMIGGGTGIASILFLNSLRSGNSVCIDKVLWAGKTKGALPSMELFAPQLEIFKKNIAFATDDGSAGEKGRAPEVLLQWLEKEHNPDAIVSCGPREMMKEIKKIADKRAIPTWFSMEEFMACGSGACAGCAVPSPYGSMCSSSYLKVCSEGPVFKSSEVIL